MRKVKVMCLVLLFVMVTGCAGVLQNNAWNSSNTEAAITAMARVVGGLVLLNNKDRACEIVGVLKQLSDGNIKDVVVSTAMAYLFNRYGGQNEELMVLFPLLIQDLQTLPDAELDGMAEEALQAFQDGFNGTKDSVGVPCPE